MNENENIYDKIYEILGKFPGSLNILEEQIDIDVQMNYFELSRKLKKNNFLNGELGEAVSLFSEGTSIEEKKMILVQLASSDKVDAYRKIEKFLKEAPEELKNWATLALKESKMLIESKLLDTNQIFISTGLGGKGDKLRYFIALIGNSGVEFSDSQKKIIQNEFHFTLKKYNSEPEDFNFSESFATILAVVPMSSPVKAVFEEAIVECNNYGNFIKENFVITNVKKLSFDEIKNYIDKQQENKLEVDN